MTNSALITASSRPDGLTRAWQLVKPRLTREFWVLAVAGQLAQIGWMFQLDGYWLPIAAKLPIPGWIGMLMVGPKDGLIWALHWIFTYLIGVLGTAVALWVVLKPQCPWLRWGTTIAVTGAIVVVSLADGATPRGQDWFELQKGELRKLAASHQRHPLDTGSRLISLPMRLTPLSATGTVASSRHGLFVPQLTGLAGDGGFIYSPADSPVGVEMPSGDRCATPEPLSDGWWMCGMR